MNTTGAIVAGLCVSLFGGCTGAPFDAVVERKLLLQRDAEWANLAASGKDVEKIISYWSDDAVVLPPGQPAVEGKAALRAMVTETQKIPGFRIRWSSTDVTFSPDGKQAYMRSTNETTLDGPDGKPITTPGRAITVWRKDEDGQWRCVVDIWNELPAAAK